MDHIRFLQLLGRFLQPRSQASSALVAQRCRQEGPPLVGLQELTQSHLQDPHCHLQPASNLKAGGQGNPVKT